jgi:AcrR family transcriptional regulator
MVQQGAARRVPLSRDQVVRAAVALADASGIESLTMRALARELEVAPMALYKHVGNKEELVDGMIDVVFSEVQFPSTGMDWKTAMWQRAMSMRDALLRHRWAIGWMESRRRPGPANLQHHNAVMQSLREGGFSFRMAIHAYNAMDSYIYGSLLQQKSLPFETPEESAEMVAEIMAPPSLTEEYPYLAEVVAELAKRGFDYTEEFESGLDLILSGIERLRQQEAASTAERVTHVLPRSETRSRPGAHH